MQENVLRISSLQLLLGLAGYGYCDGKLATVTIYKVCSVEVTLDTTNNFAGDLGVSK